MATPNESPAPTIICPLARDEDGNAIELPSSAYAWRVRRKTGGRPRIVLGVDKQPMQLPLSYSVVDLEDILAPAEYLLDLVDAKGAPLGVTVAIAVGSLRNADDGDAPEPTDALAISTSLPTTGSETRLVLEANVRATQMAFLHNQKTLELGLRMAETLRDGVRVMAESQADWIKSISLARGFFRNAVPVPPPTPTSNDDVDEEDDEDDEAAPPAADWVESAKPIVGVVVDQIVKSVMGFGKGKAAGDPGKPKLELRDMLDWRRAAAKHEATQQTAATAPPALDLASLTAKLPPSLLPKLLHARSMLTPEQQERMIAILAQASEKEIDAFIEQAEKLTAEQLVAFLRDVMAGLAARTSDEGITVATRPA